MKKCGKRRQINVIYLQSHLQIAQLAMEKFANSTSTNQKYLEGLVRRAEVEALISIAESLVAISEKLSQPIHVQTEAL
jgi:hypothetical protein